jgi:hypothetical protein
MPSHMGFSIAAALTVAVAGASVRDLPSLSAPERVGAIRDLVRSGAAVTINASDGKALLKVADKDFSQGDSRPPP